MGKTTISWTEFTENPIRARNKNTGKVGHFCEKISPGCANCYSSEWNENRFGAGVPFIPNRADEVEPFLDTKVLRGIISRRKPTKYFLCDMTDLFLAQHPDEWIDAVFATMALSPHHTFQILTKRPERMHAYLRTIQDDDKDMQRWANAACDPLIGNSPCACGIIEDRDWPLPNVWLGVSVENQQYANERLPVLLRIPAAVRFVSYEPALGPVDFEPYLAYPPFHEHYKMTFGMSDFRGIDWLIAGGESGSNRRPCEIQWFADAARQCAEAGVAFHMKQDAARSPGQQGRIPLPLWQMKQFPQPKGQSQ